MHVNVSLSSRYGIKGEILKCGNRRSFVHTSTARPVKTTNGTHSCIIDGLQTNELANVVLTSTQIQNIKSTLTSRPVLQTQLGAINNSPSIISHSAESHRFRQ